MTARRPDNLAEAWRTELERGLTCLGRGDEDAAEEHLQRAHRLAPGRPETNFALGRQRLRQQRHGEAEPFLEAACAADPSFAAAAAGLARCVGVALGRVGDAHAVLDRALAKTSEAGLWVVRAELFLEEERLADATAALDEAERKTGAVALAVAGAAGTPAAAAPATRHAIRALRARVLNLEAIAMGREGRDEEALFAFKRASDLDPAWPTPLVNMGAVFARLGRDARARSCFERALVKDPAHAPACFHMGQLARARGERRRAEDFYRRAADTPASHREARLALCELLVERGAASEAIALLTPDLAGAADDPAVWYHLAAAHAIQGDDDRTEDFLRGALRASATHLPSLCRLASLLARQGRYLEAAALVERARQIDPARATALLGG